MTLAAADLPKLRDFYQQVLGCQPQIDQPFYIEFQLPGLRLGIFKPEQAAAPLTTTPNSPASPCLGSLCPVSLCLEVADLEAAMAHLATLGLQPSSSLRQPSHGREIDYYDPLGTRLILYQPIARLS
ncbi:VOC family protein [Leptolyngbya sp. FACHB-261]|uniref:VOC family protein n=1 Tax=Leptolyngbya sp. FACHB-261 TaxID=2692806 RepID=UPI001F54AA03|nr:VOC family protein [Leptolyngbya sp. FACHB-261]